MAFTSSLTCSVMWAQLCKIKLQHYYRNFTLYFIQLVISWQCYCFIAILWYKICVNLETNHRVNVVSSRANVIAFCCWPLCSPYLVERVLAVSCFSASAWFSVQSLGAFTFEFILKVAVCKLKKQHITANNAACQCKRVHILFINNYVYRYVYV